MVNSLVFLLLLGVALIFVVYWSVVAVRRLRAGQAEAADAGCLVARCLGLDFRRRVGTAGAKANGGLGSWTAGHLIYERSEMLMCSGLYTAALRASAPCPFRTEVVSAAIGRGLPTLGIDFSYVSKGVPTMVCLNRSRVLLAA